MESYESEVMPEVTPAPQDEVIDLDSDVEPVAKKTRVIPIDRVDFS